MKKILLTATLLIFCLAQPALSWYLDAEDSSSDSIGATSLDISIDAESTELEPNAKASNITPETDILERDFVIDNDGGLDVKYTIEYENVSGAANFVCMALGLNAKLNGVTVYDYADGPMSNFSYSVDDLDSGDDDEWEFDIKLLSMAPMDHLFEGNVCEFKFNVESWQTNFANSTQGWVDEEVLDNNRVEVQDITAPTISNVANSEPVDTKGGANDIQVDVTWDTNENATSKVVYDTSSHGGGTWEDYTSKSPTADDTTADKTSHELTLSDLDDNTTYYYRVVSKDSYGNLSSSAEKSFQIDLAATDNSTTDIVMNEFLPNPEGLDSAAMPAGEWIELYNKGAIDVDVNGWYIEDQDGNRLTISVANSDNNQDTSDAGETVVPAGGYLVVYDNSAFTLNNSGDVINFYNSGGVLVDDYSYGDVVGDVVSPSEGKTYARIPDGGFWVDPDGTPGGENELGKEEVALYREMAFKACFDERDYRDGQKDKPICNLEFLDYLDMIKSKNDLKIPVDVYETLVDKEEVSDEEEQGLIEEEKEEVMMEATKETTVKVEEPELVEEVVAPVEKEEQLVEEEIEPEAEGEVKSDFAEVATDKEEKVVETESEVEEGSEDENIENEEETDEKLIEEIPEEEIKEEEEVVEEEKEEDPEEVEELEE